MSPRLSPLHRALSSATLRLFLGATAAATGASAAGAQGFSIGLAAGP